MYNEEALTHRFVSEKRSTLVLKKVKAFLSCMANNSNDNQRVKHFKPSNHAKHFQQYSHCRSIKSRQKPFQPKRTILPYGYELSHRYKIIKCIGKGRFSHVFSAYDNFQHLDVAIKVDTNPREAELLKLEYEILKSFNSSSPYICKVYDFGKLPQDISIGNYLCMELCHENNLSDLRKQCPTKCFGIQKGALIGVEMVLALKSLHEKGYVHRDIKPSNFLIPLEQCWDNHLYVVDFGLSKKYIQKEGILQKEAEFIGTSLYASITAHNKLDLSPVDDLWSVLFVIIDISTNSLPWKEDYVKLQRQTNMRRSEIGKMKNEFIGFMVDDRKDNDDGDDVKKESECKRHSYKMPEEYGDFMKVLMKTGYNDTPKYDELIRILRAIASNDKYREGQYVADHAPEPLRFLSTFSETFH